MPEDLKHLHVGGMDRIRENRDGWSKHGSSRKPTNVCDQYGHQDVARSKRIAQIVEDRNVHGLAYSCLAHGVSNREGNAYFENMECAFPFTRCITRGSVVAADF